MTRERYRAVNGAWPVASFELPKLTDGEAKRAFRMLYRHRFGKKWMGRAPRIVRGQRRRTWWNRLAPDAGWHSFIHDLSHDFHSRQYPGQNPHKGSSHAAVEIDLIEFVVNRGWLEGKLKSKPREKKPAPDIRTVRKARAEQNLKRWLTKKKRAETAIKKLTKTIRYYDQLPTSHA